MNKKKKIVGWTVLGTIVAAELFSAWLVTHLARTIAEVEG